MISQLWQKNEIDDLKAGRSDHPAPLKSEDVAVRWENLKEKLNAVEIVFDLEKDRRRNLEVNGSHLLFEINAMRQNDHLHQFC